jgi:hypothetical protein
MTPEEMRVIYSADEEMDDKLTNLELRWRGGQ